MGASSLFTDLTGVALAKRDMGEWASANGMVTATANERFGRIRLPPQAEN